MTGKMIATVQSSYIPWKGYFDLIAAVDEFILLDDVQYTSQNWRNRNRIKTPQGVVWLTVPVTHVSLHQKISDVRIDGSQWAKKHWKSLNANYARSPFFKLQASWLEPLYSDYSHTMLSAMNRTFIVSICAKLGIDTPIRCSTEFDLPDDPNDRLIALCEQTQADIYLSGPAAQDYLDLARFSASKKTVRWFNYDGYRPYPQKWGAFDHHVSILDLLFNCGPDAPDFMKNVKD